MTALALVAWLCRQLGGANRSSCVAGELSRAEYRRLTDISVEYIGAYAESTHAAIVRARRP